MRDSDPYTPSERKNCFASRNLGDELGSLPSGEVLLVERGSIHRGERPGRVGDGESRDRVDVEPLELAAQVRMLGVPSLRVREHGAAECESLLAESVPRQVRREQQEEVDVEAVGEVGPSGGAPGDERAHEGAGARRGRRPDPFDQLAPYPGDAFLHLGRG